jgi:NAD+ synthase (glutamine-hydrolysing)
MLLAELREQRHFEPEQYLDSKAALLNDYMASSGLKSCVIAESGGIDSAIVAGIVNHARQQEGSPIENVVAVTLPVYRDEFTKNQSSSASKAHAVGEAFDMDVTEIDLTDLHKLLKRTVDEALGVVGDDWAGGQAVALARTAPLYYITNLEKQLGRPAILCGTTNRDEGAYLGYVGKASDGMVDVQLISDLHKSEVRALAAHIGVPQEIIDAAPTGDMYDGREDEQVFGASYDYVELLLLLKSLPGDLADLYLAKLSPEDRSRTQEGLDNLEELHRFNGHKYNVGSPAKHLDVMESGVPGGWPYSRIKVGREPVGAEHFVNAFDLHEDTLRAVLFDTTEYPQLQTTSLEIPKGEAQIVEYVLGKTVIDALLTDADIHKWIPANTYGYTTDFKEGDPVGSWRASVFSPELADLLWSRISRTIPAQRHFNQDPQLEVEPGSVWRPIGVSPLHRLIKYTDGGALVPHYDASFTYPGTPDVKTLKSLVVYLDNYGISGGATRFLHDDRLSIPVSERDLADRDELANEADVLARVAPKVGSALLFDHVLLHDGEPVTPTAPDGSKVILRTDIVYTKC